MSTPTVPPTPTPTLTPTLTPTATPLGVTRLDLPIAGAALPSPDGTMIAGADPHPVMVTIYTLQGKVLAQATAPPNSVYFYRWLPDSSGLLIWPENVSSGAAGPVAILSPNGSIQSTGLPSVTVTASPDSRWIAALGFTAPSSPASVAVTPRQGGAVRTLASGVGVVFLGWQAGNVVYAANGNIYAIAPTGGAAHLLVSEGGVAWGPSSDMSGNLIMSPDGQVVILFERHHGSARLVGTQVLALPPATVDAQPPIWSGPHQAVGLVGVRTADVEVEVVIVDMVSGTVVQDTGAKAYPMIEALSGEWLGGWAQAAAGLPQKLHFTNLVTKREVDLGPPPNGGGGFYSLGQGRFFLHGGGQSYLLDPAAAATAATA